MHRDSSLARLLAQTTPFDVAIIGGGATGVGIALDAASRGYSTCLLEQSDFGKGTSSRSTKLIHGGVRYLQQGNIALVTEALNERGILRQNAPHLVHDLPFIVPNYAWWEAPFYGIGMRLYDLLAGRHGFGKSQHLSTAEVLRHIPTLDTEGLRGGILYHDGQFDDARLLIDLAHTADAHGAILLNYAPVTALSLTDRTLTGLTFTDLETRVAHTLRARCIINAAGPFGDAVRRLDPAEADAPPMLAASQGAHLVLDRSFLPGDAAIMIPRTADGRVLFAIPWLGHTLLGTTDTPIDAPALEPVAQDAEIDFILATAAQYLARHPTRADILSVFAGVRPLIRAGHASRTASLSREHSIHVSPSGLLTIAGGKWTTYRKMAQETVDRAAALAHLAPRPCITRTLAIADCSAPLTQQLIHASPHLNAPLHPALSVTAAHLIIAARHEMARTLEDTLARRTRALFLNARAACAMAPAAAQLLADELSQTAAWQSAQLAAFASVATGFLPAPSPRPENPLP